MLRDEDVEDLLAGRRRLPARRRARGLDGAARGRGGGGDRRERRRTCRRWRRRSTRGGGAVLRDAQTAGVRARALLRRHRPLAPPRDVPRLRARVAAAAPRRRRCCCARRVTLYEDSLLVKSPAPASAPRSTRTWPTSTSPGSRCARRGARSTRSRSRPVPCSTCAARTSGRRSSSPTSSSAPRPSGNGRRGDDAGRRRRSRQGDVVSFETGPGDVVVHHARTIHGAAGNASATRRRRAISVRYCGDDARFHRRPGAPLKPWQESACEGRRARVRRQPVAFAAD